MTTEQAFIRLIIHWFIVLSICAGLISYSGQPDAAAVLMLPFFLGIPASIVCLAIFAPMEQWLDQSLPGGLNILAAPLLLTIIAWAIGEGGLAILALLWGGIWIITHPIYHFFGKAFGR